MNSCNDLGNFKSLLLLLGIFLAFKYRVGGGLWLSDHI